MTMSAILALLRRRQPDPPALSLNPTRPRPACASALLCHAHWSSDTVAVTQPEVDHGARHGQDGDRPRAAEVIANALSDQQLTPKQRLLRDELGFVAGVANIACATSGRSWHVDHP